MAHHFYEPHARNMSRIIDAFKVLDQEQKFVGFNNAQLLPPGLKREVIEYLVPRFEAPGVFVAFAGPNDRLYPSREAATIAIRNASRGEDGPGMDEAWARYIVTRLWRYRMRLEFDITRLEMATRGMIPWSGGICGEFGGYKTATPLDVRKESAEANREKLEGAMAQVYMVEKFIDGMEANCGHFA